MPLSGFLIGCGAPLVLLAVQLVRRRPIGGALAGALVFTLGLAAWAATIRDAWAGWGVAMLLPFIGIGAVAFAIVGYRIGARRRAR